MSSSKSLSAAAAVTLVPEEATVDTTRQARDERLVLACRRGDQEAFRELYHIYVGLVRSVILRLGAAGSLDDGTQEVFLRIWRALPQLTEPAHLSTWIYRICVNVATDSGRKAAQQKRWGTRVEVEELAASTGSGTAEMHAKQIVSLALAALDEDSRAVLVLYDMEGLSHADIAKVLSLPVGTVKSRLFYARQKVRAFFAEKGIEP